MANTDRIQGTGAQSTPGLRPLAGAGAGRFHGVTVDVDDRFQQSMLRASIIGQPRLDRARRQSPLVPRRSAPLVRTLSASELARHARVSGDAHEVSRNAVNYLRRSRLLRPGQRLPHWRSEAPAASMQQYLGLQKLQAALKARLAAHERQSHQEAEQDFMANLALVSGGYGNATELAERLYEALKDSEKLNDMLAAFDPERRDRLSQELRECGLEYDPRPGRQGNILNRNQVTAALARAMDLEDLELDQAQAAALLEDVQEQLAEMEGDKRFGRYSRAALNTLEVLEDVQRKGGDALEFQREYYDLVSDEVDLAAKCQAAAQRFIHEDSDLDLNVLYRKMWNISCAAGLDWESARSSILAKEELHALMESSKLIARLTTASMLTTQACAFLERAFGREVNAREVLHRLLERLASPHSPPTSFMQFAERMGMEAEALPATLTQLAFIFRAMREPFQDTKSLTVLLDNLLAAQEEAARLEDERAAGFPDSADYPPFIPAAEKPGLDAPREEPRLDLGLVSQKGESWTGSTNQ